MFKNSYQSGYLSILYSIGSKPLQLWDVHGEAGGPRGRIVQGRLSPAWSCIQGAGTRSQLWNPVLRGMVCRGKRARQERDRRAHSLARFGADLKQHCHDIHQLPS